MNIINFRACVYMYLWRTYRPVLAKAIHSLSRIGDELYVEPQQDGVSCSVAVIYINTSFSHVVFLLPVGAHFAINTYFVFFFSCSWPCGLWTPLGRHMHASCLHHSSSAGADCVRVYRLHCDVWMRDSRKTALPLSFLSFSIIDLLPRLLSSHFGHSRKRQESRNEHLRIFIYFIFKR